MLLKLSEAREQNNSPQENQKADKSVSVLVKDGKIYLPASLLADEFGYATDHIARIARQNKVEAIYENKKWYATRESVVDYKEQAKQNKMQGGLKSTAVLSGQIVLSKSGPSLEIPTKAQNLIQDKKDESKKD